MSSWRRDFASGLVVLVPLIVILYVLSILYSSIVRIPGVATILQFEGSFSFLSEVFGFFIAIIIFLLLVLSVGYLMRTTAGRLIEAGLDASMNKVPLVRIVYNASKLAVETALTGTEDLQKPVRLETWPGIRMTAFKTGKTTSDGKEIIFMPTAPNITTGFVMEVDPEDIEETGEKVEEALTRVLSAGFAEQEHIDEYTIEVTEEDE
ncbi:hypothetical protein C453_03839 [Haloferax elongans ATCC BAA-1513]|uniref:DUF502 domain-containing protein n=1 Tax=Haloferax elongans ATCC BAA-1513 TaxID=1230453 RepID=M0HUU3_HALEO|nr:DUF502 domain-containing protein [Haloferax elongans]ELZ87452.1 hypothetical protein C453_03839 [Haloferax elongans ATCC BAA-1513]